MTDAGSSVVTCPSNVTSAKFDSRDAAAELALGLASAVCWHTACSAGRTSGDLVADLGGAAAFKVCQHKTKGCNRVACTCDARFSYVCQRRPRQSRPLHPLQQGWRDVPPRGRRGLRRRQRCVRMTLTSTPKVDSWAAGVPEWPRARRAVALQAEHCRSRHYPRHDMVSC